MIGVSHQHQLSHRYLSALLLTFITISCQCVRAPEERDTLHPTTFLRRSTAAFPAAVAGSIALTMTGPAAYAAGPVRIQPPTRTEPILLGSAVPAAHAASTERSVPMAAQATTYTVRSGDTVTAIAIRHGLRTADVLAWNKLTYSSVIYPGQVLRLTAPGSTTASKPAPAPAATTTSRTVYTVKAGDTVAKIAARYGVTIADIVSANKLANANLIYVGQHLVIQKGATSAKPAGTASAPPASTAKPAASTSVTYTVKAGDTVAKIAARYGVTIADIVSANKLANANLIYVGQHLVIRKGAASAQPAGATTPPKTTTTQPAATTSTVYTVKAGDTVAKIAAHYGVTIADIVSANKLANADIIYVGERLVIRKGAASGQPAGGSTTPTPVPAANVTAASEYVVRAGDTVSAIAAMFHVSTQSVLTANKLSASSIIYPGQKLKIPVVVIAGLTAEQSANVRTIVAVGRSLGVPDRGIEIALGTAMTESGLRNLTYGDRDSLGLFQQRPSTGWGTKAQILDPVSSTTAFFLGRGTATRGLLDIKGWQTMPYAKAAQAVQISAFPNAYAVWEQPSQRWLAAVG